jgi:hypothetical protein
LATELPRLDPEELRRFARRDWGAPARLSRRVRAALPVEEKLRLAVSLYESARAVRPDWPDDATRLADIRAHQRLRNLLDRAAHVGTR